jgi:uncharacterized protein YndB with AHSA1/START domain
MPSLTRKSLFLGGAIAVALVLAQAIAAHAEVVSVGGEGFELKEVAHILAPPDKVYAALIAPAQWWSGDHTFSHSAANLTLDAKAGGCFCETLPGGGSVQHLAVVYAAPGKMLRLRGTLGPFQSMPGDGVMTFTLAPAADGTDLTMTYAINGYLRDGFDDISKGADEVLAQQLARLKLFIETGSPDMRPASSE